jgi:hypothetical protein
VGERGCVFGSVNVRVNQAQLSNALILLFCCTLCRERLSQFMKHPIYETPNPFLFSIKYVEGEENLLAGSAFEYRPHQKRL